jgi:phenylpropionate dioxygenase-like ring-hydroxylating dioxygenase large terminal subunit
MQAQSDYIRPVRETGAPGKPLAPWTYSNPELFNLEYEAFFLKRWQFAGHENDLPGAGDFLTVDIGQANVFVMRGNDGELRAFLNVCRHRGSRILEASGTCPGVIRCPYHGWSYQLDGSLKTIPQEQNFPDADRTQLGLNQVELEVFFGLLFVRVLPGGSSIEQDLGATSEFFEKFGIAQYEKLQPAVEEVWDVNWKVAWDNYQENYHIPIGHPGLQRLLCENDEFGDFSNGLNYGTFVLRDKPSKDPDERLYQELFHHSFGRVPDELKGKWVQIAFPVNHGIEFYPEMLDIFQLIPLGLEKTLVRASFYVPKDRSPEEIELIRLNLLINNLVNQEDITLCARVQKGLKTPGYVPGPLSMQEDTVFKFHELVRDLLPVSALAQAPTIGTLTELNEKLLLEKAAG